MKNLYAVLSVILLTGIFLCACSGTAREQGEKINIICTIFPHYDWTRQIIGEENAARFNLTLLIDNQVDMHSFNPSVQDIVRIKSTDAFIFIGGNSDGWVEDVLRDSNPDMKVLSLLDALGDDALIFGNFCSDDCDEEHDHVSASETVHADEHIWVSLRHAQRACAAIAEMLSELDPENSQTYGDNAEAYIARLSELDALYQTAVDAANLRTVVVADRFPFRYMMTDYGLSYYAAFQGCSAETEASFTTVISLANRINQLGLNAVVVTKVSDRSIAETVIRSTERKDQKILVMDDMKTAVADDNYLSVMESNLAVLKEALR